MKYKLYLIFTFVVVLWLGCSKDECSLEPNLAVNQDQLAQDIETIDAYLAANEIEAQTHPSGLRYVIKRSGEGDRPNYCSNVSVSYEGKTLNGNIFDSRSTPINFPLQNLITGWQIGIPLIKEGGRITLYIPSVYAYGANGIGSDIPPNASLEFEIVLFQTN
jgi:FKBP-type peptidyl-prolyl cis-trans isomerase FkpA